MTVLLDQNISYRIITAISALFDEVLHVRNLGWVDRNDHDIFMDSRKHQYDAVITLDEDFNKLLLLHGTPPKVIWLKTGNCSTAKLAEVIVSHTDVISKFLTDGNFDCLEVY